MVKCIEETNAAAPTAEETFLEFLAFMDKSQSQPDYAWLDEVA